MTPSKDEITRFSIAVETYVIESNLNYIEGFIEFCEKHNIEMEVAIKLISPNLKGKIEVDANHLNLLKKKTATLPI